MKNILFYYDNYCEEGARGGTEVATYRIAKALKDTGQFNIFHAFRSKTKEQKNTVYNDVIKLSKYYTSFVMELADFISRNEIDAIINMGRFFRHKALFKAAASSGRDVQLIFMHHFAPGSEIKKGTFQSGKHLVNLNPFNPLYWLRASIYPIFKLPKNLKYKTAYKNVYDISDRVVLLSEGYKNEFAEFASLKDLAKFSSIPNIFENKNLSIDFDCKEKRVLILSRMDEIQKRISEALKIWAEIEKDPSLFEWDLDIVGDGHNMDIVKRLIKKLKLKRVNLYGWQSSDAFLKKSSILMSTSNYEGLPLSILEACAYGCVPIAYDSYASLRDVIENGKNGIIVKQSEGVKGFAKKLSELMHSSSIRNTMALEGQKDVSKFSPELISEQWEKILI